MEIALILGFLIGALQGITGAGGGILAVPALMAGMGWPLQQAAPVALVAVTCSAAIGTLEGFRRGLVRYKAATLMALAGLPVSYVGMLAARALPQRWLLAIFALLLFFVAGRILLQKRSELAEEAAGWQARVGCLDARTGRFVWTWPTALLLAGIGGLAGFMTGLLGVGGGFIIVPLLRKYTKVAMHGVVATSLMVIALVGGGSVLLALLHGVQLPLAETGWFALAVGAGMLGGRALAGRLPAHRIHTGFGWVLLLVAIETLGKVVFWTAT